MRCAYDDAYAPPAPVAAVTVRRPATRQQGLRVQFLLDTGADVALLPPALVRALAALPARECLVQGVDGITLGPLHTYFLEFELDGYRGWSRSSP